MSGRAAAADVTSSTGYEVATWPAEERQLAMKGRAEGRGSKATVLIYSDNAETRAQARLAIGRKPASDTPPSSSSNAPRCPQC